MTIQYANNCIIYKSILLGGPKAQNISARGRVVRQLAEKRRPGLEVHETIPATEALS